MTDFIRITYSCVHCNPLMKSKNRCYVSATYPNNTVLPNELNYYCPFDGCKVIMTKEF